MDLVSAISLKLRTAYNTSPEMAVMYFHVPREPEFLTEGVAAFVMLALVGSIVWKPMVIHNVWLPTCGCWTRVPVFGGGEAVVEGEAGKSEVGIADSVLA